MKFPKMNVVTKRCMSCLQIMTTPSSGSLEINIYLFYCYSMLFLAKMLCNSSTLLVYQPTLHANGIHKLPFKDNFHFLQPFFWKIFSFFFTKRCYIKISTKSLSTKLSTNNIFMFPCKNYKFGHCKEEKANSFFEIKYS